MRRGWIVITTCWAAKGGSGCTSVAVSLAILARSPLDSPLLLDLGGDMAAVLGRPDPIGPGLSDWLASEADVGPEALDRLVVDLDGYHLLSAGTALPTHFASGRIDQLMVWLAGQRSPVLVDAGCVDTPASHALIDRADRSLLVTRLCYLSMRRAVASPRAATGVVLLREAGRSLKESDVASALNVAVVARLDVSAEIARAIDAGLLEHRMPSSLRRALAKVELGAAA